MWELEKWEIANTNEYHSTGSEYSTVRKGNKATVSVSVVLDVGRAVGKWFPCSCIAVERSLLKQSLTCRLMEWGSSSGERTLGAAPMTLLFPRGCFEPPLEAGFLTRQTFGSPGKPLLLPSVVCTLSTCALLRGTWKEETMNYLQWQPAKTRANTTLCEVQDSLCSLVFC